MAARAGSEKNERGLCGLDLDAELAALSRVVEWMKSENVESLTHNAAGVSIKLADPMRIYTEEDEFKGIAPVPQVFDNVDGAGVCSCGHSWVEHSDDGCLQGCSHETCISDGTKEPGDE